jgi:hypothetical protein
MVGRFFARVEHVNDLRYSFMGIAFGIARNAGRRKPLDHHGQIAEIIDL